MRQKISQAWIYLTLMAVCLLTNIPVLSMIGTAFKPRSETLSTKGMFTAHPTLDNFYHVLTGTSFARSLVNTVYIALVVTVLCVAVSAMAGYALSRCRGRLFGGYTVFLLVLQMLPAMLIMIPLYVTLSRFHLVDTHFSLILIYTAINLPFGIWTLKGFFDGVPLELDEAAMIDGCSWYMAYRKVVMPFAVPGIVSVGVFTFMNVWNEYTIASVFIQDKGLRTLSVGIRQFMMQNSTDWASMSAAATIAVIPAFIMVVFAQKYLVGGLLSGSVKG